MPVLRNKLKSNFTLTPNELLVDNRLSMGAKVVYIYLASKPDGWKVWNKEIQKSLDIKDSGTMAKYWNELIDCGWVTRERDKTENGQFTGGYEYELRETPYTEETRIQEKPVYGKNPDYINTDINNNTKLNNNTDISAEAQKEKPKGRLIDTKQKVKKPKENGFIEVLNTLCSNDKVKDSLLQYCIHNTTSGL